MTSVIKVSQIHYPESDGKPMGETDDHRDAMVRHIELLQDYYSGRKVYVSGDLMIYYVQGDPKKSVVPDTFVAKGVPPGKRRTYKIWVEGKSPDVVIETTSRKTRPKDTQKKPALYARLGVGEYFLFDPHQEYLDPPLQGYCLTTDGYQAILPDADGFLISEELELRLRIEEGQLQFYRMDTGERLLSRAEARRVAEAEVVRLRAELERLRRPIE